MKKVLITGGTGLLGSRLITLLLQKGYEPLLLSRNPKPLSSIKQYRWNIEENYLDTQALKDADYIVHLAGEGIADKKWDSKRKQQILESRTKSSALLLQYLQKETYPIKAIVAASAIGYYGDSSNEWVSETASAGTGFLSEVCVDWEKATVPLASFSRLVQLRIGIVLSTKGGALVELEKPIHFGLGAYIGNGLQYYSWIHIDDLCGMMIHALENENVQGVYNATAPNPVHNKDLVDAIRFALKKPSIGLPSPAFAIKLAMGEMATMVLNSCRTSAKKIEQTGYKFLFKTPTPALHDLYKKGI